MARHARGAPSRPPGPGPGPRTASHVLAARPARHPPLQFLPRRLLPPQLRPALPPVPRRRRPRPQHARPMVAVEVRAALVSASALLNTTLWWVSIQTGLRIAYGLSLWATYALEPWLRRLLSPA